MRVGWVYWIVGLLFASSLPAQGGQDLEQLQQEEGEDYFRKWLTEDVVYIISPEERSVFESLTTAEEKEQFIEQFWFRRDPDPRTAINEFKEEHYRRIAYVNERYYSGVSGWKTDRGKIYIIHGPPTEIDPHPSGGPYERPLSEGGGTTVTFPFEVWRYKYIEGIGSDVLIEFVDPAYSGEYRLARDPDEKDAFSKVPTVGLTFDERDGFSTKAERGGPNDMRYYLRRDQPFDRYRRYFNLQKAPVVRYRDLQELVNVDVSYDSLPFQSQIDYFRLGDDQVIVPLTIEVPGSELSFIDNNGQMVAQVALYGLVTGINGQIVAEFEDDLAASYQTPVEAATGRALYQKMLVLDRAGRFKLDLVVKDVNSGKMSVIRQALVPPRFQAEKLEASSLVLSDRIVKLQELPLEEQMFTLGDVIVRPNISRNFPAGGGIGIYFQLYNFEVSQSTGRPSFSLTYELCQQGEALARIEETDEQALHFFSDRRAVFARAFPTGDLPPGDYSIIVKAHDQIGGGELSLQEDFTLRPLQQ